MFLSLQRFVPSLLSAVLAALVAMAAGCRESPSPAPDVSVPPRVEEAARWTVRKDVALAELESERFEASVGHWEELSLLLPDEPLVCNNLVVSYLLWLKSPTGGLQQGTERYAQVAAKATAAAERLTARWGDSAASHVLAAKAARLAGDSRRAMEAISRAAELSPNDPAVWFDLFQTGRRSDDAAIRARAAEGLRRAYALESDNLLLIRETLLQQAADRDAAIVQTLRNARSVVEPLLEESPPWQRMNLTAKIDEAIALASKPAGDGAGLDALLPRIRPIVNVLSAGNASRRDCRRIDRGDAAEMAELAYLMRDFRTVDPSCLPRGKPLGPAVPVRFAPFSADQQPPPLAGATAVELADWDCDGRLDLIVVDRRGITVLSRGVTVHGSAREGDRSIFRTASIRDTSADRPKNGPVPGRPVNGHAGGKQGPAWRAVAEFAAAGALRGVLAVDLDRDFDSASHAWDGTAPPADLDLIAYGPGGVVVLENRLDAASGKRSLQPVPQCEALAGLRDVRAAAAVDLDHDGNLDLVVASPAGISLWRNAGDRTFQPLSGRARLPDRKTQFTALLPVDSNGDGDVDVLAASSSGDAIGWLANGRHGRFAWTPLAVADETRVVAGALCLLPSCDAAGWDVVAAGPHGLVRLQADAGSSRRLAKILDEQPAVGVTAWDYDNDGCADLIAWGPRGLTVYRGDDGSFQKVPDLFEEPPANVVACAVGDLDGDGDLDLVVALPDRVVCYSNEGGNRNRWLDVALAADPVPSQSPDLAVNMAAIGSVVEVKVGAVCQRQWVRGNTTHFGLGTAEAADVVRVLWTNGTPCITLAAPAGRVLAKRQKHIGM